MTAPRRVLHVHSGNLYGGVETCLTALARMQGECPEMESSFALCFDGRLGEELTAAGATVHRLGAVRFRWPWTIWLARRRLRRLLARNRYDVAMFHSCWSHALFAPVVKRQAIPIVHWIHGLSAGDHWLARLSRRTMPDLVLANSQFIRERMVGLFPGVRVEVQYPLCPTAKIPDADTVREQVRAELNTPPNAVVVLSACRLERLKGHPILIDALARLADLPDWHCWVAGGVQRPSESRYFEELKNRVAAAGLGHRVRLLGARRDVPRLMAAADVYCQPNLEPEAFGLTFVEAMSAGLPVVTSAIGGALELVGGESGVLVPSGDAEALAAALRRLIRDPAQRVSLGVAGPGRAAELCSPEQQVGRLADRLAI